MASEHRLAPDLLKSSQLVHRQRDEANEREALLARVKFTDKPIPEAPAFALAPPRATAVLVVHGMGQQLPFETLDALANGLYREDVRSYGAGVRPARVAHVQFGQHSLERVEMQLRDPQGQLKDVHLYEAYWAPLTEGAVNLRDVIGFLISAGLNGVKNSLGRFSRWSFGAMREYYVPLHTLLYLLIALCTVASLVILNTAISAIAAAKALFTSPPAWLTPALLDAYTSLLSLVVGALEILGATIFVAMLLSWGRKRLTLWLSDSVCQGLMFAVGVLSVLVFTASVVVMVGAASAVPMLFRARATVSPWMVETASVVRAWQLWIVAGGSVVATAYFVRTVIKAYIAQLRNPAATHWPAHVALGFFLLLAISVWRLVASLRHAGTQSINVDCWSAVLMWGVLVILSLVVRMFLVQYVGDVAAYVQPHTLDRFSELRAKIKERVLKIAEAIYAQKSDGNKFDYDKVVLVGHSLGSVIVYDTLNRLLLDDNPAVGAGRSWSVARRSSHLLTFGSPLNKIAFVFSTQSKKRSMTLVRERLAALVQPLIDTEIIRAGVRWVNVYSPWDIISGRLDFYDPPEGSPAPPVLDERDPEAITFLAAHTEYWRNTLVFAWLHTMI